MSTECDRRGVNKEFCRDDDGKNHAIKYQEDSDGQRLNLTDPATFKPIPKNSPKLTERADQAKCVLKKIAIALSADSTTDLTRLLRIPGSYNRKGGQKVRCRVVRKNLESQVELSDFGHVPEPPSAKDKRGDGGNRTRRAVSKRPDLASNSSRKSLGSAVYQDGRTWIDPDDESDLRDHLDALPDIDDKDRSKADFAFCCWAVERGFDPVFIWSQCQELSKFAERGEEYFEKTWENATEAVGSATVMGPCIKVGFDEEQVNSEVLSSLVDRCDLYQQNGQLVEIVNHGGSVLTHTLNKDRLREIISGAMSFSKSNSGHPEQRKPCRVPPLCPQAILSRPAWTGIRQLNGIRYTPLMTSEGEINQEPGYNKETGIFLHLTEQFPSVSETPRATIGREAMKRLENLVRDFPFATQAHKSAWLAALLTGFAGQLYAAHLSRGFPRVKGLVNPTLSTCIDKETTIDVGWIAPSIESSERRWRPEKWRRCRLRDPELQRSDQKTVE